jgi:gamma-glutamyltranspeptidase/glutathione hydrolase
MQSLKLSAWALAGFTLLPAASAAAKVIPVTTIGPIVSGKHGMVVSSNSDAARVGVDVLAQGGNAVDAAIAMEFALNVSEPAMSGIGGGGFMVVREAATGEVTVIDSRERAPASATPEMFTEDGAPLPLSTRRTLGEAVGVPGALAGAEAALAMFGTWTLRDTLDPAIELAEDGVIVTEQLAHHIAANASLLAQNPAASAVFMPGGQPLDAGDLLVQPDLAATLWLIGQHGADIFYDGDIGAAFVAEVQAGGGGMTLADLQNYEVTFDAPVRGFGFFGDHELVSAAPPSSGGLTVLQMLAILDRLDPGQHPVDSALKHHLVLEAMRLAFADRRGYLGDPAFVTIPLAGWLNPTYVGERAGTVELDDVSCPVEPGLVPGSLPTAAGTTEDDSDGHTTHFTVADRWGNLVAFTTSIEQHFGTGRMVPGRGFMLNNELCDFDPTPGGPNSPAAGKRPLSSMSPTLVLRDGAPVMALGSPGGPRIIAAVAQVLLHVLEYDLDLETAVALPRVYGPQCSGEVRWDAGLGPHVRGELAALGHEFEPAANEVGDVNLIVIDGGTYTGVADPRRDGVAAGLTFTEVATP